MPERSTESDSDFQQVAPRTRTVPNRVRAVEAAAAADTADAQVKKADKPASPKHQAVAPLAHHRIVSEIFKAFFIQVPVPKAAFKAPAAPDLAVAADAKATSGAPAVPADANKPRRVSARRNKGQAPLRYSPSSSSNVTITTVLLSLFLPLLATAAGAQDVIVLPKFGDVDEKIEEVAVNLGSAQFPMVLRLVIHDTVHNNGHSCLTSTFARHNFDKEKNHLIPSWTEETRALSVKTTAQRQKRSPILAAVGIAVGVSALFNLF